ncbi:N-6 DNA methylase [Brachyspira hyodysenteriae]|uniref:type ISP restriction/modification enzyme n=3 Tax=Brachyspira hyodysenteriae TaxID=159 RepID=UPI001ADDCA23|nr:type ISP restriction/modification enzyme [Brachyspira hyodysenteriae]MBT8720136.1 N-6 DNA methylase [Brachyspira hyodysenteriae]MBT8730374.1 N-6 DNA methylase [Brachyspira hyodysenteriae]MBT8732777.1 N-6 DNA methylase [Brachyspira hyodysenteriae]MBT8735479.1 N-6 DNA methylase [Brachyspira hyodysenteriae]MBT8738175.1 N-6 DNA methylase [Brachyspira hyodysenteriae]
MNKEYIKAVKNYIEEINSIKEKGSSNEHSYRTPLENMLKFFAVNLCQNKSIKIVQESSIDDEDDKKIFPDFTIVNEDEQLIGFIECKDTDFDLNKAISGKGIYKKYKEQLIKYLYIHNNLIFTDYINFILLSKEDDENIIVKDDVCIYDDDAKKKKDKEEENYQKLINILDIFFMSEAKEIDKKDYFLSLLARRTKILRDFINLELLNKESYLSRDVKGLFENTLFKDLSDKDFADAFSQIITFSLLFYRLSKRKNVDLNSFKDMPDYIPIFKEFLLKIDINDFNNNGIFYSIVSIMNAVNSYNENIFYGELSYKENHDKEDPFIYMYEYFLKEFDEKTRNARGVFYTPIEAVRYIIKSIDELLKDKLNISEGLYGENVHILDFAAGTGTFMLGAIELAYSNAKSSGIGGVWEKIVSEFILKRLYGFEFLIVPYVLAHFRIHEYLKDLNYDYKSRERLQLYLTNTLDNSAGGYVAMFPNMKAEADMAYKIKNEEPILVIMGNPPYNSKSEEINCKEWIINLLKDYKQNLNEKKINLDDDYIKFLRFAHWKMDKSKQGIIGVIVNNSFINGVTHREMRNQLMKTFDEIYIFDLHGNMNKGEKCPDGSQDFNIFNIKDVGVCIALLVKTGIKNNKNKGVYFQEIFGKQNYKKEYLIDKSVNIDRENKKWKKLEDDEKWHWFTEVKSNDKYLNDFKGLHEIFEVFGSGVKTDRDSLFIDVNKEKLINRMKILFSKKFDGEFIEMYNVQNSSSYNLLEKLNNINFDDNNIIKINYRPFDFRLIYYKVGITSRPSYNIMKHFINRENIGLVFPRQIAGGYGFQHGLVSNYIIDVSTGGAKTGSETYFAPLYIYEDIDSASDLNFDEECKPNFKNSFLDFLKKYLGGSIIKSEDYPHKILSYIYAVLYAPTYRSRYKEDLKYDYPRIPFTDDGSLFDSLSSLGSDLIDLHLLKKVPAPSSSYPISGDDNIDFCKFEDNKIKINSSQYFDNISEEVYNYSIGGYKPIEKYIKARETLTLNDIMHIQKVISVIEKTIEIQKSIDEVYKKIDN